MKSFTIDYKTIANILGVREDYVRRLSSKGMFDMSDPISVMKFLIGELLQREAKK